MIIAYEGELIKVQDTRKPIGFYELQLMVKTSQMRGGKRVNSQGMIQIKWDSNVTLDLIEKLRSSNIIETLKKSKISLVIE